MNINALSNSRVRFGSLSPTQLKNVQTIANNLGDLAVHESHELATQGSDAFGLPGQPEVDRKGLLFALNANTAINGYLQALAILQREKSSFGVESVPPPGPENLVRRY